MNDQYKMKRVMFQKQQSVEFFGIPPNSNNTAPSIDTIAG